MIYLKRFVLPSESAEIDFIKGESRTCFHTFYPFKIFTDKQLRTVEFDNITLLYGGNGSGKSTLLNVIARKICATRFSIFNGSPFFDDFVDMCYAELIRRPCKVFALASDDVFDYSLSARSVNSEIDGKRDELIERYMTVRADVLNNPEKGLLKGLDDYERWSEAREILSPRRSQSSYVKGRVKRDVDLYSNGQTAMRYFTDRVDGDGLYLLDEPENSLSVELAVELKDYIEAVARSSKSQFIIATHSPILLSMKGAKIYDLDDYPVSTPEWTELPGVRRYFDFFMEHKDEF